MIAKCIIFIAMFLFVTYRLGVIIGYFIKNQNKLLNFLYGFLILLGTNQIILTPCVLLHTSFNVALYLTTIINIILVVLSFFIKDSATIPKIKKQQLPYVAVICFLVIIQMVFTTISYKENADDSYYVSLSLTNIDSEAIYMTEPSMGENVEGKVPFDATELIPTFELQIAIWAKLSSISPTIICHSLLPMLVIFMAYLAYYYLSKTFFKNKKYAHIFLIILAIIFLFTGFSNRFRPGYLLTRGWQGKTLFLNISLTIIIASLIKMDQKVSKKEVIILGIANLFSLSLSSTAIFIIPFTYMSFGILKLIQRKWKHILYMIISFIPVIIYVLVLFILIKSSDGALTVDRGEVNLLELIKYYKNYTFLCYYLIATIVIMILGNKEARRYFGLIQIINLLTIWNPLFSNFLAKYLTSSAIFWRVLWLIPIEFAISYAITLVIQKIERQKIRKTVFAASIIVIIISGKFMYNFEFTPNLENIPQEIIEQTNYILEQSANEEEIMVLGPQEPLHSCTMRQIDNRIILINSRAHYMKKITYEEIGERVNLSKIYEHNYIYNESDFYKLVKKYDIDWIIVDENDESLIQYIQKSKIQEDIVIGGYILYKP